MANTSGSTRTAPTTSAYWAIRRSFSRSSGITRRSPALRCAPACRCITASPRWRSCPASLLASSLLRTREPEPLPRGPGVFRIDHDEAFNMTAHLQYQTPWKRGPWFGFNWRYDSGLVAGAVPCYGVSDYNDCPQSTTLNGVPAIAMTDGAGIPFTADQEFQAGFTCNGVHATPTVALPSTCLASQFGSTLTQVPTPGTQNDD